VPCLAYSLTSKFKQEASTAVVARSLFPWKLYIKRGPRALFIFIPPPPAHILCRRLSLDHGGCGACGANANATTATNNPLQYSMNWTYKRACSPRYLLTDRWTGKTTHTKNDDGANCTSTDFNDNTTWLGSTKPLRHATPTRQNSGNVCVLVFRSVSQVLYSLYITQHIAHASSIWHVDRDVWHIASGLSFVGPHGAVPGPVWCLDKSRRVQGGFDPTKRWR